MLNNLKICLILCCNLCILLANPTYEEVVDIPEEIPRCNEDDDDFNECMRDAFQNMVAKILPGIPELNIPPMDPLTINKADFYFANIIIRGTVGVEDVQIRGLGRIVFNNVEYKRKDDHFTMKIEFELPNLSVDGKYKAKAVINGLDMDSKGEFVVTMSNISATCDLVGKWYERDGKKYLRLNDLYLDPTLGNMDFYASGLDPDIDFNEEIVDYVNQNWRFAYKYVIGMTRNSWEPKLMEAANDYFSHIALDGLLLKE